MRSLYFGTGKLAILAVLATTLFAGCALALSIPTTLSDLALLNNSNLPGPDTAIYCGVRHETIAEPYTLHISATAPTSAGTVTITFVDRDGITFKVPAGGSFSITQELGQTVVTDVGPAAFGPVDHVVKITVGGGVTAAMASVRVRATAKDPFNDDGYDTSSLFGPIIGGPVEVNNNFCLTKPGDRGTLPPNHPFSPI